jgi:hypothetical protein
MVDLFLKVSATVRVHADARCARDFARAAGYLAKTDTVDARMLAAMGQVLSLVPEQGRGFSDMSKNTVAG